MAAKNGKGMLPNSEWRTELPLWSRGRAWGFLLAVGLAALLLAGAAVRTVITSSLEGSRRASQLRRALTLDPANPAIHYQLGLLYSYSPEDLDPPEALKYFRQATDLNPYKAIYWTSVASACDSVGDHVCADHALERALTLSPMTPRFHWLTANHYLVTDRAEMAFPHFQRLLELSPDEYAWPTFRLCLKATRDPQAVLQKVLPRGADAKLKLAYVDFLSSEGNLDFAYGVWGQMVANGSPFAFWLAAPYLQRLLDLNRYKQAINVWGDLERLGIVNKPPSGERDNLIYNGDFEQAPLNAGFDWHTSELPYLWFAFPDSGAYQGRRCLRLDFTVGRNDESEAVYQFAPASPNQQYLLTAYTRSDNITSDSGPRLRVIDPVCPTCLDVSTEPTVGTTPWHQISLKFSTDAHAQVVRVSVWRPRSRTFPTEITGTFWLDTVSLKATGPVSEEATLQLAH
jgi:tetratricopeptide (TPR) repeat protein